MGEYYAVRLRPGGKIYCVVSSAGPQGAIEKLKLELAEKRKKKPKKGVR